MPAPILYGGAALDLSPRLFNTAAVVGSPALNAETIIASVAITQDVAVMKGVFLSGWASFLIGASGTSYVLKLRRTSAAGTTVATTGLVNVTAADVRAPSIAAFDVFAAAVGQIYVMTLTVTAGGAESTVSAVQLVALAV